MRAMVTIGMNYTVLPGKEELFERAFRGVLAAINAAAGHAKSQLFRDVDQKNVYLILSEWHERSAFDEFIRSEAFAKVTNWGKEQILAGRPQHSVYTSSEPLGRPPQK